MILPQIVNIIIIENGRTTARNSTGTSGFSYPGDWAGIWWWWRTLRFARIIIIDNGRVTTSSRIRVSRGWPGWYVVVMGSLQGGRTIMFSNRRAVARNSAKTSDFLFSGGWASNMM